MTNVIQLLGSGPSHEIRHDDVPIAALSSGLRYADNPELFITCDPPIYFSDRNPDVSTHVPCFQYIKGFHADERPDDLDVVLFMLNRADKWFPGWADYDNVRAWDTDEKAGPSFNNSPIGMCDMLNSLVFAPQLLYRLGFRTIVFAGCDCREIQYAAPLDILQRVMWPLAKAAGMRWVVTSKHSLLSSFLEVEEPARRLQIA